MSSNNDNIEVDKYQLLGAIYDLAADYLAINLDKHSGDCGYNAGLKDGINGFTNYLRRELCNTIQENKTLN